MDAVQSFTNAPPTPSTNDGNVKVDKLDFRHWTYIDYMALNGLIFDSEKPETNKDGVVTGVPMRKMSHDELAQKLGVTRPTLYNWRNSIPDFWGKVNQRRREIAPQSRLAKVHEVWFLSALQPGTKGFQDRQLFLANFDDSFRTPTQRVEHEAGNTMVDFMRQLAEKKRGESPVIEAEVTTKNE